MKKNNSYLSDDEIDLSEIFRKLWKEKILVFSISVVFMIIGYIYGAAQPKYYKTEFKLESEDSLTFEMYLTIIEKTYKKEEIVEKFNKELKFNLLSFDLLLLFIEQNNKINDFKFYLKEKNIDIKDYFKEKFKFETNGNYSLTYSKPLAAEVFLNDYIIFVKEHTLKSVKKTMEQIITKEINLYRENLVIAEKIGLEYPVFKSTSGGWDRTYQSDSLFYQGTIALSQQLVFLNKYLDQVKDTSFGTTPILVSFTTSFVSVSTKIYVSFAFVFGLFFSMMILFLRTQFKKNSLT